MRYAVRTAVLSGLLSLSGCSGPSEPSGTGESGETGDETDGHASVRIRAEPEGGDASIFDGTATVRTIVDYESCLRDFYLVQQPTFVQDGMDGMPVFEAWVDKLCTDFDGVPDCTVDAIHQTILTANSIYSLSVEYSIGDPTTIANREFHVGPLPNSVLAGCRAEVELRATGLVGYDAEGNELWVVAVLPPQPFATSGQMQPIVVTVRGA